MKKTCTKCGIEYPATAEYFHQKKGGKCGLASNCKGCVKKYHQRYYKTPEGKKSSRKHYVKHRDACLKRALKRRHGVGAVELWTKFFVKQGGCCLGCGKHQSELEQRLSLDHDHETGKYRGLLCGKCNHIAGSSEEHITVLENITKYLKEFYGRQK